MFEFIIGEIISIKNDYVVVQNNGIGYKIFTSTNTMSILEIGKREQLIYTQLHVRDDGLFLFGFSSEDEMDMFNLLLRVSKVGPKVAVGILSTLTPNAIRIAILNKDIDGLCKGPGVGKKTAERIIVELKDRIDKNILLNFNEDPINISNNNYHEAIQALMSLGYMKYEVEHVIKSMDIDSLSLEEVIKEGLKKLSKQ